MQIRNLNGKVLHEVPGDTLKGADLSEADLAGADLRGADLSGADLRKVIFRWADLRGADLREAVLRLANLVGADLVRADLSTADLTEADLSAADLVGADLRGADLSGADLTGADLREADLAEVVLPSPITPSEGEFLGYKKVRQADGVYTVITLRIPADAQRTSALTSRKCRASHVIVVNGEGVSPTKARSKLRYTPDTTVTADSFNPDRREECTNGIHFFLTHEEAEAYQP
jgi:hypothetical protein